MEQYIAVESDLEVFSPVHSRLAQWMMIAWLLIKVKYEAWEFEIR